MLRYQRLLAIACFSSILSVTHDRLADEVRPATHVAPVRFPDPVVGPSVRFSHQPAQVGDSVAQQVNLELSLSTSIIQSGQVAHREDASMRRQQHREVEVLEVVEGRVCRARVTFSLSRVKAPENAHLQQSPEREVVQPVEGKTYLLTRQGEQLLVTDTEGAIPPRDEFEIVLVSMQSLGRPSPLGQFLLDRTIRVGQTLELPKEIAEQMLGFGNELGEVKKFELQLQQLSRIDGEPCAVFAASIEVAGRGDHPMQISVTGPVVILTETCRTTITDLTGPLSLEATQHTSQGDYQYRATGSMRASLKASYSESTQ